MDIAYNKTDGVVLPITNTRISASEYNQIAASLMQIITSAGLTPDAADNTQLLTAIGHRVVETYKNGSSWYRIWSDGWCEQGGAVDSGVGAVNSGTSVTYLKAFADTNYAIAFLSSHEDTSNNNIAVNYGNYYYGAFYPSNKSATGIVLRGRGTWYACGYIS